jgi:uncharacterized protein (DUF2267 family)
MTTTTIASFTQAAQQAQHWVNELSDDLMWNPHRAYRLLRSVLHTLRDFLSPEEMADLAAQLPVLVRGVYFEGWKPQEGLAPGRKKEDFVVRVERDLSDEVFLNPDHAIAAVFKILDRHLDQGEIAQVRNSMKKALRRLWPAH